MTAEQEKFAQVPNSSFENGNAASPTGQPKTDDRKTTVIRDLNDRLRKEGRGGIIYMTNGVAGLGLPAVHTIFKAVAAFADFNPDNDPWGEHDCGCLTIEGRQILWKIDYYDRSRTYLSPDPADSKVTVRVLTVMLAQEY